LFHDTSGISSGDEITKRVLTAEDLKAKVVGSTLRGEYPNHVKWAEFYDPSGEIRGTDDEHGAYTIRYTLDGNKLCYDYPGNDNDWCATLSLQGDDVQFSRWRIGQLHAEYQADPATRIISRSRRGLRRVHAMRCARLTRDRSSP